ncbi:phosphopentomutase [Desulfohalotomaculum tongense]|uniref:phosphopentomutase n=1 Tax=Desulforadius tongensis TaxID=1216062 RepID=UPI00195ADC09|nr:phosphopentomutase [Desulforadius tongensis]MBM7854698.1 phosphopentomutase [Desulforadius tongensis]
MTQYNINRVILIVLDSVGIGELPDAAEYGDSGSNTLANTAKAVGGLNLPNMANLGLGNIAEIDGVPPAASPAGAYGKMGEKSPGKDTTTGHWELSGVILDEPFPVFPNGFPASFIEQYQKRIGREILGNKPASGTKIIEELGRQHMETGKPIVYTSADSVFQIAAHEEIIPLDQLYHFCKIAREMLTGDLAVGRVIARPFLGQPGSFKRTANRHDYSLPPVKTTILDVLTENNIDVMAVGKIVDIFAGRGITDYVRTKSNMDGVHKTIEYMRGDNRGLIFTNLVEYDQMYGHRNDPQGYAKALEEFDAQLPEIINALNDDDILIITADHGCDPTTESTDHSREYVPLLVYGPRVRGGVNLGVRSTFSDVAATIAEIFNVPFTVGTGFAGKVLKGGK